MASRRIALALAAALGVLALGIGLMIRSRARPPVVPLAAVTDTGSEFRGVELNEEDPDGTRWRVSAESGTAWEEDGRGTLKGVRAVFQRGEGSIRVAAGQGRVEAREFVRLSGGVRVEWGVYWAETRSATYHRGEGMVRSSDPVIFRGPGIEVRGTGLEVDVEGRRARIPSGASATMTKAGA